MSEERRYFVYIMANASKRIYTGMTNSIRRVREHKLKLTPGFAAKYNIARLVYFEIFEDVRNANRAREANKGLDSGQAAGSGRIDEPHMGGFVARVGPAAGVSFHAEDRMRIGFFGGPRA